MGLYFQGRNLAHESAHYVGNLAYCRRCGQHCLPVLWVIGIGIGLSLTAFFVIRSWERRNIEKAFLAAADDRASAVKGAFSNRNRHVGVGSLVLD